MYKYIITDGIDGILYDCDDDHVMCYVAINYNIHRMDGLLYIVLHMVAAHQLLTT